MLHHTNIYVDISTYTDQYRGDCRGLHRREPRIEKEIHDFTNFIAFSLQSWLFQLLVSLEVVVCGGANDDDDDTANASASPAWTPMLSAGN